MRVGLADDSTLFRSGLAALLSTSGVIVTEQARTAAELESLIGSDPPDAVVLDIRMPPTFTDEGLRGAASIRAHLPSIGVLVLSTYAQADYAAKLLEIGDGVGYLLKDRVDDVSTLTDALSRVIAGESVIDSGIVARLLNRQRRSSELSKLTERERDVLRLMAEGHSNAGIGQLLFLSPKTVEAHSAAVFGKLGLQAAATANRRVLAALTWLRAAEPHG